MKKLLISSIVGLTLLGSSVAYASGSWTTESQTAPKYQGTFTSSSVTKVSNDNSASVFKISGPDINICAMSSGNQVGSGATAYSNTYSYSNYYSGGAANKGADVNLKINTRNSSWSNQTVVYKWSPDTP